MGLWVVIEHIDGAGGTTLAARVSQALAARGHRTLLTAEPGGLGVDPTLRERALQPGISSEERQLWMALDARQNFELNVEPAFRSDTIVIQDRGQWSALVYSGMEDPLVESVGHSGQQPDLYVWLDTPVETCMRRRAGSADDPFDSAPEAVYRGRRSRYQELFAVASCRPFPTTLRVHGDDPLSHQVHRVVNQIETLL